jgi:hypothetical protein
VGLNDDDDDGQATLATFDDDADNDAGREDLAALRSDIDELTDVVATLADTVDVLAETHLDDATGGPGDDGDDARSRGFQ